MDFCPRRQRRTDGDYNRAYKMADSLGKRVGRRVAAELRRRKWSQGQLAAKAGCTQPVISDLLAGRTGNPKSSVLVAIADALEVPVDRLVGPRPTLMVLNDSAKLTLALLAKLRQFQRRSHGGSIQHRLEATEERGDLLTDVLIQILESQAAASEHVVAEGAPEVPQRGAGKGRHAR